MSQDSENKNQRQPKSGQGSGRKHGMKPSHVIPVWNGILDHREPMGAAVWEYLWCLDKITVEENGIGWCLGKTPIQNERIARDLGEHFDTARVNLEHLTSEGYIIRKRTPRGYLIGVTNSKKFGVFRRESDTGETQHHNESDTGKPPDHNDAGEPPDHSKVIPEKPVSDAGLAQHANLLLCKTQQEEEEREARAASAAAFAALGTKPFGTKQLRKVWPGIWQSAGNNPDWVDVMERTIQSIGEKNTPTAFILLKRKVERGELIVKPYVRSLTDQEKGRAKLLWDTAEANGWTKEEFEASLHYDTGVRPITTESIANLPASQFETALARFKKPSPNTCAECGRHDRCEHKQAAWAAEMEKLRNTVH